ncbi:uncharacterized protein TRIVIDRAFT_68986 [Trichoderma virens Gv29-8]|uniref:C2H2-type domain-containing protein n=1 Tax=Hypocrea virens (strain Gv29-8 / FGSC 10586) TaxID=413071 RepID=G9MYN6_HYPVG|nr:uncharacterized protein TRIVIDRAFT_68986 [Trichoderma virens Gv29-8]EHK20450.1 hypothetical protein TRIVIDRAFT_68986 [Trichoderma virens Gv29-8]
MLCWTQEDTNLVGYTESLDNAAYSAYPWADGGTMPVLSGCVDPHFDNLFFSPQLFNQFIEEDPSEMQQPENEAQTSPMRSREDLYPLNDNSKSKGKTSRKLSARKRRSVVCDWKDCKMVFPRSSDLNKHVQKKHNPHIPCKANQKGYALCAELFSENKDMERHIWARHPGFAEDPANEMRKQGGECPLCGRIIKRKDNIKRHIDEKHLARAYTFERAESYLQFLDKVDSWARP